MQWNYLHKINLKKVFAKRILEYRKFGSPRNLFRLRKALINARFAGISDERAERLIFLSIKSVLRRKTIDDILFFDFSNGEQYTLKQLRTK